MNPKQIAAVRRVVSRAKNSGNRVRYSEFVKETATMWLRDGESPSEIAAMVGIGLQTLTKWADDVEDNFRKVCVAAPGPSNPEVTATLSDGVRIVSPSIEQLIEALEFFK